MILKAGTYRFNDVLTPYATLTNLEESPLFVTIDIVPATFVDEDLGSMVFVSIKLPAYNYNIPDHGFDNEVMMSAKYHNEGDDVLYDNFIYMSVALGGFRNGGATVPQEHTIAKDIEVDDDIGNWYISNTDYAKVNKPLATIEYNGSTIAELNAGETATLSCEGMKMASDVVVKVNEVESKIPDGYIKPEGTLELVFNNIEAEFPIDCSKYAKVTVNTAEPLKITDPTVLDNITDSPYGVGGSVFLYEGATTDTYENGTLYYLEDTDK